MFWTTETAIFFATLGLTLLTLLLLDKYRKSTPRTDGFIPLDTTRGDRFFLWMISMVFVGLLWMLIGVPGPMEYALIPVLGWFVILMFWG